MQELSKPMGKGDRAGFISLQIFKHLRPSTCASGLGVSVMIRLSHDGNGGGVEAVLSRISKN